MIMNNRRVFYDESMWERFENKLKTWTYALMHELLQNQVCSVFLYKILILIETIQIVYYSLHPNLKFLFTTDFLDYFRQIIQYFQVNYILSSGGSSVFLIVLYLAFSVEIIMLLIVLIITFKLAQSKRKSSTFLTYLLKIFSLYGLLLNTIITIPFFNAFIATIFCQSDAPFSTDLNCYEGIYFLHLSIAIIGFILFLLFLIIFGLLYIELNPNSTIPFAAPQSRTHILKQLLKLILPFYFTFDYAGSITKEFISILAVYYLIMLIQRYRSPPFYNKGVYYFTVISEAILCWVTLVGVIHAFLDFDGVDNIGLFYMVLGIPFISLAYTQLLNHRQWILMRTPIKQFKKETDIEMYINLIIELIENREKPPSRIKLEGLLKLHLKNCNKSMDACVCTQLASDNLKDEDSPQKLKRWYLLLRSIMSDALDKFQKCPRLHLLNAYIHHEKLKNKFKALFELMITEENKPNLQEEFSIYRYKNLIEEEMVENDTRNSESKGVDVNIIVVFQNKFVTFLSSIEKSVNLHLEFWRELLEENPDIQKLQSLGSKITNTVESTNDLFKRLNEMNPNHIKCLEIYGNFLKDIVNDDVEGQRILEKSEYIGKSTAMNKQFIDNDRQKYGENSNTCIITVSGNFNNIGIVTNTNNEITRILGFSKSDLIGQNVNRIMPKVYADQHDQFMRTYLESSESKIIGVERLLLAQNKSGYLVPCTLMIKVLPNLDEGIQIVGFLKDIELGFMKTDVEGEERVHYMVYNANTLVIMGVTYSCYQSFGIPASLVYGNTTNTNEFTLDAIAQDLADPKNIDDLKTTGMIATIDTTNIQQNYLLGHGDSDEELSFDEDNHLFQSDQPQINISKNGDTSMHPQQQQHYMDHSQMQNSSSVEDPKDLKKKKAIRYRKARIRAQIIDENEFGDQRVQILKFVEVDENEEIKQQRSGVENQEKSDEQIGQTKNLQGKVQLENEPNNQQQAGEDLNNNNSDRDSNYSGQSVNDDMRQLKDFKALISEKTEPKSIRILKRTVWILMMVVILMAALILGYRMQQNADVQEGANSIYQAYFRHNIMADVNFYTRLLEMLATGKYYPRDGLAESAVEEQIKTNISNLVDQLQEYQFDIIKARIQMEARMSVVAPLETYPIQFLLQNGENKTYQNIFNDALFQLITSASSIRNSSLVSFNNTDTVESTQKNFFYVMVNGLFVLRNGSEKVAQRFYNFYYDEIQKYSGTFIVIMAVAVFCLFISQCILIPIVFQVHKTNNRVMSLFGIIPIAEIKELSTKCEKYIQRFLEDKNEKKEDQQEEEKKNDQDAENQEGDVDSKMDRKDNNQSVIIEMNNEEFDSMQNPSDVQQQVKSGPPPPNNLQSNIIQKITNSNINKTAGNLSAKQLLIQAPSNGATLSNNIHTSITPTANADANTKLPGQGPSALTQGPTKNDPRQVAQQQNDEKKDNEEEIENLRSQKLLNSKDNNKSIVIFKFSFFALLFIAYFIADITLEMDYLNFISRSYNHLRLVSMRPSQIKYTVYFTIEEIITGMQQLEDGVDLRKAFETMVYENERDIFTSLKESYPAQYDTYTNYFQKYNYEDLCKQQFTFINFTMSQPACELVDNGLLSKGLRTAVVSITLATGDMISQWQNTPKDSESAISLINSKDFDKLQNLIKFIAPSIDFLNDEFMNAISNYLSYQNSVEQIKFSLFIVAMIIIFIVFWTPYLNNLSKQIWRTKGMLNMIPMEIIQKYPNLKQAFIGGDILQAVK